MVERVSIIIKNGIVVTMDNERRVFDRGYVIVDGNRIVEVGKDDPGGRYEAEEIINASGGVVLPGFICAHTHLYGALLRASTWFAAIHPPT
ncbi:MAG: amidohydrolase, partial [Desulfurococcales archaeon]|nr:amidohydrolase [Desulfurococcales archaeon]